MRKIFISIAVLLCVSAPQFSMALTLEEAMNKAEAHSYNLKIAAQNVTIATQNKNQQILSMLPNVSLQSTYLKPIDGVNALTNVNVSNQLGVGSIGTNFTASLNLNQPIIGLYSTVLSLYQTAAQMRASLLTKNQTLQDARLLGATAFINCEKAFQLIDVADASIDVSQKQYDDAQARFKEGLLTNADALKFQLNLDTAKRLRIQAETTYQITLITLAEVIGEENRESIELPRDYKSVMEDKKSTLGALNPLITTRLPLRYDFLASQENVTAQYFNKLNVISTYLPTLNFLITYTRDFEANAITNTTTGAHAHTKDVQDQMFYGATLTWNLLDWGIRQTQINSAAAGEQIARLQSYQIHDNAKIDIVSSYNKLLDAYESLNLAKRSVESAESIYKQRYEEFLNGRITSTDLVIAANDQTKTRADYVLAVGDLDVAWMAYYKSVRLPLTTL